MSNGYLGKYYFRCKRDGISMLFLLLDPILHSTKSSHRPTFIGICIYTCMYACIHTELLIFVVLQTSHTCGSYFNLMLGVQRAVPALWRESVPVSVWKVFVNT